MCARVFCIYVRIYKCAGRISLSSALHQASDVPSTVYLCILLLLFTVYLFLIATIAI